MVDDDRQRGPDTETSDGVFQAFIDLNALADGDIYEFRIYEKVLSSSTQRCVLVETLANSQSFAPVFVSPSLILINGWDMTLLKVAGTDRSLDWSIRKLA